VAREQRRQLINLSVGHRDWLKLRLGPDAPTSKLTQSLFSVVPRRISHTRLVVVAVGSRAGKDLATPGSAVCVAANAGFC
jgi:hypothetical protein